jgi:hypothetical protein
MKVKNIRVENECGAIFDIIFDHDGFKIYHTPFEGGDEFTVKVHPDSVPELMAWLSDQSLL